MGWGVGRAQRPPWRLVNSPRIRFVRWDSRAQGLLIDRSLFQQELLCPGGAQGPAPHTCRATQFRSFVHQFYRYGFHKVPGWVGSAVPGDAGARLHYSNPCFRRDRPNLLFRIRQRPAAGREGRRRPAYRSRQLPGTRLLPDGQDGRSRFKLLPREQPPPAERDVLRILPCNFLGLHGEQSLPFRWQGPSSHFQEFCGEQLPLTEREVLRIQQLSAALQGTAAPSLRPLRNVGISPPVPRCLAEGPWHPLSQEAPRSHSGNSSQPGAVPGDANGELTKAVNCGVRLWTHLESLSSRLAWGTQDNTIVAPHSSGGEPVDKAAAEEALPGTESCRNNSQEPEEPDAI
ncbi:uncharacterized protein [Taeniopygia guttata]|uniref:uncharacterized protein isoform X2 n=1 Tax=Taeniopygia guttata TaxID=59729 RepID=UPI0013F187C8